jgi:hypothetical protein
VARDKASFLFAVFISELRLDNLTKTDDVLLALGKTFATYMKNVFPFQYKNKTYRLINNYVASPYTRCDVCGNHPIIEVSVIRSEDGQQLRVGNDCIDRITNRWVSEWFNDYRRKRQNVINNREYIDELASILKACEKNELPFQISNGDVVKMREMFELLCKGLSPTRKQERLAECYLRRKTNV